MAQQQAIPIIEQVDQILRNRIFNGEYEPDTRLPSETKLAEELGVSRVTIRTVLARLETQGIITRKHGDGTYVNKYVLEIKVNPTKMMAYKYLIEETGRNATVKLLINKEILPSPEIINKLNISNHEKIRKLICVFYANDQPAIYSENYFPANIITVPENLLDVNFPMHEFIKKFTSEIITYSISDFMAVTATEEVAKYLEIKKNFPILHSIDIFYNLHDKPLALGYNYFQEDAFKLRIAQTWI